MFISHEGVAVNLDRVDYIKIERNCITTEGYGIVLQLADERLTLKASKPMTEDEVKFVYGCLLASINGAYYNTRKKRWAMKEDTIQNVIGADIAEIDSIIKLYHEEFEKFKKTEEDSQ
jgi:hypothetical protein